MTNEEAIKFLRAMQHETVHEADLYCASSIYGKGKMVFPEPEDYAIETAIEALEKQIPKKPIITNFGNGSKQITCNTCSMCLHIASLIKYCPYCSQRIDWEDDKE